MRAASVYNQLFDRISRDLSDFGHDIQVAIARSSDAERVIGICVFALMLLFIMIRRPHNDKNAGSMGRQFVFALAIVTIFGFGVGWMFDGKFELPRFS